MCLCVGLMRPCGPNWRLRRCESVLDELKTCRKIVGTKQLRKALSRGEIRLVFLAEDADPALTDPLALLAGELSVQTVFVPSMKELGRACGIAVGAAAAGLQK